MTTLCKDLVISIGIGAVSLWIGYQLGERAGLRRGYSDALEMQVRSYRGSAHPALPIPGKAGRANYQ